MDDTGVAESAVIGMAVVKKWDEGDVKRPTYYLDNDSRTYWHSATDFLVARAILDLPKEQQARLHLFICGISSADRNAVDHVERMLALYPDFWQGIGEIFCGTAISLLLHTARRPAARPVRLAASWTWLRRGISRRWYIAIMGGLARKAGES